MSMRHRYGQQCIVRVAVDSATAIAMGDLVYLDTDDAKPASSETWYSDLAATQAQFQQPLPRHRPGGSCRRTAGRARLPGRYLAHLGLRDGLRFRNPRDRRHAGTDQSSGNALVPHQLKKTSTAAGGCARCMRRDPSASDTVMVRFQSTYWGINDAGRQ